MRNTNIGTLFLDRSLIIRKVSDVASVIINVLMSDIGRPISNLAVDTLYEGFMYGGSVELVHNLVSDSAKFSTIIIFGTNCKWLIYSDI